VEGENIALARRARGHRAMKSPLSTFGGVEFAVYTSEDQLTLNPHLELFIYARTDQWFYILKGRDSRNGAWCARGSWRLNAVEFAPAPDPGTGRRSPQRSAWRSPRRDACSHSRTHSSRLAQTWLGAAAVTSRARWSMRALDVMSRCRRAS
jgi:hypothetical protein